MGAYLNKILPLVMAFSAIWPLCAQADVQSARVLAVHQGVASIFDGKTETLAIKMDVPIKATVRSDNTGRAQLILPDNATVSVAPDTELFLAEYVDTPEEENIVLNLATGTARFITGEASRRNPAAFTVHTPQASISIRGTMVTIQTIGEETRIYLNETSGKGVTVTNKYTGKEIKMRSPGKLIVVRPEKMYERKAEEYEAREFNLALRGKFKPAIQKESQNALARTANGSLVASTALNLAQTEQVNHTAQVASLRLSAQSTQPVKPDSSTPNYTAQPSLSGAQSANPVGNSGLSALPIIPQANISGNQGNSSTTTAAPSQVPAMPGVDVPATIQGGSVTPAAQNTPVQPGISIGSDNPGAPIIQGWQPLNPGGSNTSSSQDTPAYQGSSSGTGTTGSPVEVEVVKGDIVIGENQTEKVEIIIKPSEPTIEEPILVQPIQWSMFLMDPQAGYGNPDNWSGTYSSEAPIHYINSNGGVLPISGETRSISITVPDLTSWKTDLTVTVPIYKVDSDGVVVPDVSERVLTGKVGTGGMFSGSAPGTQIDFQVPTDESAGVLFGSDLGGRTLRSYWSFESKNGQSVKGTIEGNIPLNKN